VRVERNLAHFFPIRVQEGKRAISVAHNNPVTAGVIANVVRVCRELCSFQEPKRAAPKVPPRGCALAPGTSNEVILPFSHTKPWFTRFASLYDPAIYSG
jgi:hypothetical protein